MTSPYVTSSTAPTSSAPPAALIVAKVVAGLTGAVALLGAGFGAYLLVAGGLDGAGDDDSLAGLALVIGAFLLIVSLPVLGLCVAVVRSSNPVVVGVCGLLVAVALLVATALSLGGAVGVALGLVPAAALGGASLVLLAAKAPRD